MPLPLLLLLDRAGLLDRLAAALRFVPFDDDFVRPSADDDAFFFAVVDRLDVRDAVVLLRVLAALLRVLALFGLALLLVPLDFAAVDPERFAAVDPERFAAVDPERFAAVVLELFVPELFAPELFGLVSAICPPSEAVTCPLPGTLADDPFSAASGRFG